MSAEDNDARKCMEGFEGLRVSTVAVLVLHPDLNDQAS